MKDWGLSFKNKKSAKIFYQILKEGVISLSPDTSVPKDELLGKRDSVWSDDELIPPSEEGSVSITYS